MKFILYSLWLRIIGADNANAVLKNFHKTISKLEMARNFHIENMKLQSDIILAAEARRDRSDKEALQAETVASKLRAIVDPTK